MQEKIISSNSLHWKADSEKNIIFQAFQMKIENIIFIKELLLMISILLVFQLLES